LTTDDAAMMASKKNNHLDLGSVGESGSYAPLTRYPSQQSLTEAPPHVPVAL
jgi:hypothetical protein